MHLFHLYDLDHPELRFVVCIIILREIYTERISNAHTLLYPSLKRAHRDSRLSRETRGSISLTLGFWNRVGDCTVFLVHMCAALPTPRCVQTERKAFFFGPQLHLLLYPAG